MVGSVVDTLFERVTELVAAKRASDPKIAEHEARTVRENDNSRRFLADVKAWLDGDLPAYVEEHGTVHGVYDGDYGGCEVQVEIPYKVPKECHMFTTRNLRSLLVDTGLDVHIDDNGYVETEDDGTVIAHVENFGFGAAFNATFHAATKHMRGTKAMIAAAERVIEKHKREVGYEAAKAEAPEVAELARAFADDVDGVCRVVESGAVDVCEYRVSIPIPGTYGRSELVLAMAARLVDRNALRALYGGHNVHVNAKYPPDCLVLSLYRDNK